MSNFVIEDGTGKGYKARVTREKRLSVYAIVDTSDRHHAVDGVAFAAGTGPLTITGSALTALFYLKNQEDSNVIIDRIVAFSTTSVSGSGDHTYVVYKNPSGGTIVTNEVSGAISNRNFGSSKVFSFKVFKGAEGDTLTGADGAAFAPFFETYGKNVLVEDKNVVLAKNSAIGISLIPPAGNTSMKVQVAVAGWVDHLFDQGGTVG